MNWLQFGLLIKSIYGHGKKLPDLEWIQDLGLLAVKLGQVHALRIDFLDREKCEHLAKLFRQNRSLPPEDLDALLIKNAPTGFKDSFASIEPRPLASASVGQVHRGVLRTGRQVVVKVIKQDVRRQFMRDTASLRRLFGFITFFYPKLKQVGDPVGILGDIEEYTLAELDLRNEVAGQQTLKRIYEDNRGRFDLSRLEFPQVHTELCNENVMVSDLVEGRTFDEMLQAKDMDYDLLLELFHVHGFYLFGIGTFHGDIHPGNIIYHQGRLCFIDTGYIGTVGPRIRKGLFTFFEALSVYEYPACAAALHRMSERELPAGAYRAFEEKFLDLYKDFTNATVSQVSLTKQMMKTIKLGVHSGMAFEKGIFAIIRSLMYLDGMVLRCNPQAVLLKDMRRFIREFKALV
jgi:ubiquinone biosynthesis protein